MEKTDPDTETQEDGQRDELRARDERIQQLTESLARAQADYANYRRRTEEEREQMRRQAARQLLKEILTVLDNLELALRHTPATERGELYQGVELTLGQLTTLLEDYGVTRVPTDAFDSALHEALLTEESKQPKGTILEVLQHGYALDGQVLRTAKVKVSAGQADGGKKT